MTETTLTEVRIDALVRITQAIETAATIDELLLLTLHELTQLFAVGYGGVALLGDDSAVGQIVCEYPPHAERPPDVPLAEVAAFRRAILRRQSLQFTFNDRDSRRHPIWAILRAHHVRSVLLLPMVVQDRAIGALLLGALGQSRRFEPDEVALARMLVSQIAAAVSAFRLREAAERRNDELSTLNDIASTITSTLDTHEVYRLVVQKLSTYFNVEAGSLLLIDETSGDLEFVMTIEGGEEKLAGVRVPMGQGVVGHVAQTRQWEIVHDAQNDPRFYRKISEDLGFVTRSILCVPMIAKGRVIGVIELLNKLDGRFTEDEAQRLTRMAAFIGVAIENAHLFQQVADGRDRLAAILNSTADGILMTDMWGVVLSANPMAAQLFESNERHLVGRALDELLQDLYRRADEVVVRPWPGDDESPERDDRPVQISEVKLSWPRQRFIRLLRLPVRDAHGEVYGQLALFRDITQEKELEQLRDDYTHMLIHDLRAPLTSIMNGIMMVHRGLGGPVTSQQRELLQIAHQGSETMLELVNNLLDISKMEQGRLPLDLKPLSPYAIVDRAIERLQVSARSQRIIIQQCLELGLPLIEADSEKIVRVLQNLLDNAIKFSPSGGTVTLGAHWFSPERPLPADVPLHPPPLDEESLVFWVQDQGPGIPPAYHSRVFEKFGQVRGRKVRGTGLGLTFCKLAVEAHHGRIWLESDEGAGSTFAFALPLVLERELVEE